MNKRMIINNNNIISKLKTKIWWCNDENWIKSIRKQKTLTMTTKTITTTTGLMMTMTLMAPDYYYSPYFITSSRPSRRVEILYYLKIKLEDDRTEFKCSFSLSSPLRLSSLLPSSSIFSSPLSPPSLVFPLLVSPLRFPLLWKFCPFQFPKWRERKGGKGAGGARCAVGVEGVMAGGRR